MITLQPQESDSLEFLVCVEHLINGVITIRKPERFYVIKIKNWFGEKWVRFAGKVIGLMGVRPQKLRIPPFIPSRVLSEECYVTSTGGYSILKTHRLHTHRSSSDNLHQQAIHVVPPSILFWYSSNSATQGRGSVMVYFLSEAEPWPWYVEWIGKDRWVVSRLFNVSMNEVQQFLIA